MHVVSGVLVVATAWEAADHMLLVRCVRDSLDVGALAFLVDHLEMSSLPLLVGEPMSISNILPV